MTEIFVGGRPYTVMKKLGEGSYAIVYAARSGDGSMVAIKKSSAVEQEDVEAAKREVQILKELRHDGLVNCVGSDVGRKSGAVCILAVMPMAVHGNMIALINKMLQRGKKFSEDTVLKILRDVSGGVAELHAQRTPIAHRDMKVENILGYENSRFKLCDFGSTTTHSYLCRTGKDFMYVEEDLNRRTTLAYRAPEQCNLMSQQRIDQRVDDWALGVILFMVCFFELPFPESTSAITKGSYTLPSSSSYSTNVTELIRWILNKDASTRPSAYMIHKRCSVLLNLPSIAKETVGTQPQHPSLSSVGAQEPAAVAPAQPKPKAQGKGLFDMLEWAEDEKKKPPAPKAEQNLFQQFQPPTQQHCPPQQQQHCSPQQQQQNQFQQQPLFPPASSGNSFEQLFPTQSPLDALCNV